MSNKEIREMASKLGALGEMFKGADKVEEVEFDSYVVYVIDGRPLLFKVEVEIDGGKREYYMPVLAYFYIYQNPVEYPSVVVDEGAVPRILNGADVMRPGIKEFKGSFKKGDVVVIRDLKGRAIAIGIALVGSDEAMQMQKGKVVKNVHYLGDDIWKFMEGLLRQSRKG